MAIHFNIRLSKTTQVAESFTKRKSKTTVGAVSKFIGADKTLIGANSIKAGANTKSIGANKKSVGADNT